MQLEIYQWLVPLIGLFYILRTIRQFKRNKRSLKSTIVWFAFWIVVIILALIPNEIAEKTGNFLGFKDNVNAIIFVALGLLFLFVFYISSTVDRLESQLTHLVRNIALQNQKKKEKTKDENSVRA